MRSSVEKGSTMEEAKERYINELAVYIRWSDQKKIAYGTGDVMAWGDHDYQDVHSWNDGFRMIKRVLNLSDEEDAALFEQAKIKAQQPGKDTPWNYWVETPV